MQRQLSSDTTYFSRRRRAAATQTRLPDWVWGAGLGALVLLFIGGFFLVNGVLGGGGGSTCDEPLVPLGSSEINAETFAEVNTSMTRVVDSIRAGDSEGAFAIFTGTTHNFTHNVDPELREADEDAAKELCESVLAIEETLFPPVTNPSAALDDALRLRSALLDAADILGYSESS